MEERKTNIFVQTCDKEIVLNTLPDLSCLLCIDKTISSGVKSATCPLNNIKKRMVYKSLDQGELYICDSKEKTSNNFKVLAELIEHSVPNMLSLYKKAKADSLTKVRGEIDSLKHNIEHINSDAINEFYSFIPQETFVRKYRELLESVKRTIKNDIEGAGDLITRLARYNLNVKTELSVFSKLNNPTALPNYSLANPRDTIMTNVYMLYPDFKKKGVYVDVGEYYRRFNVDFEALQVATYYLIENAAKYTMRSSRMTISFSERLDVLVIEFAMKSLYVNEGEEELIFTEGYKGEQAQKAGKSGKGIGLNRAMKLINFCKGRLTLEAGEDIQNNSGLKYASNTFRIFLPTKIK